MAPKQPLPFDIRGSQERTDIVNHQLYEDLKVYATRPFLNGNEKHDLDVYRAKWQINHIISLFTFDKDGNFLPDIYSAPKNYLRMLYPIDDIMSYNRQGTLIIDREQYSPELRNLSFFIYMVDAELYEQYAKAQHFNGTRPTYMFDQNASNGVRVFKDYAALANHLRQSRLVTYCLGPRATFYLRYFIYQIHVHTIDNEYVFGERQNPKIVNDVLESIKRHLAFNHAEKLHYDVTIKEDDYSEYRKLKEAFMGHMYLPEAKVFKNHTDIIRYRKQTLRDYPVYHAKRSKVSKFKALGIQDYHNCIFTSTHALFFIWDNRSIEVVVPMEDIDVKDFMPVKFDNHFDLSCRLSASKEVREVCEQLHNEVAIQMRDPADSISENN